MQWWVLKRLFSSVSSCMKVRLHKLSKCSTLQLQIFHRWSWAMTQGFPEHNVFSKAWSKQLVLICCCLLLLTFSQQLLSPSPPFLLTSPQVGITEGVADIWKQERAQLLSLSEHYCCTTAYVGNPMCHLHLWCTCDLIFICVYMMSI